MTVLTSYLFAFYSLFMVADPQLNTSRVPEMQQGEWLLFEPLDLQLNGPCYDVAFFRDDLIFMKSGEETLHLAPVESSGPDYSQSLFVNRDISCSPAAISFSKDYSKVYYTRPVLGNEQMYLEKIFEVSLEGNQVSGPRQLPFSRNPSRSLHPALSSDGSLMVFSSDRLPARGGLDLFITQLGPDGWSEPMNMGEYINTSGHEWFPFLDRQNNLWFSSSGHDGYGGFDIYLCPYEEGEWGKPLNLGTAFNGPQDELGFSVHPQKELAVFSRSWTSGDRGMAILVRLNESAFDAAGIDEAAARNIILLIRGTAEAQMAQEQVPESETNTAEPPAISEQVVEERPPVAGNTEDPVVFRVQIISSLYENSFPTVLIDGIMYETFEYYYLDSYRITVGAFFSLEDANEFRLRCLDSGFKQAFVAAFRGGERITDPGVFKQ